ncbi:bacterioferritin-associated ferredoxin [Acidithiobacillus sp. AMEEHan]|uniref:bacterioferritin-associated ferredoxin n=1 Tax=Acidithiobacillus sp. AMEEHan TaxID=2994951 RepID=UPI0035B346EF
MGPSSCGGLRTKSHSCNCASLSFQLLSTGALADGYQTMYVCICHGVTESELREAIRDGAHTLRALRERLGVATNCGRCAACARGILLEEMAALLSPRKGDTKVFPLPVVSPPLERRTV